MVEERRLAGEKRLVEEAHRRRRGVRRRGKNMKMLGAQ